MRPLLLFTVAALVVLAGCGAASGPTPTPVERTVVIEPPSPTPAEHTVTVEHTVIVERTVIQTRTITVPSPTPRVETVVQTAPEPTAVPVQGTVEYRIAVRDRVQDGWLFHYIQPTIVNQANIDLRGLTVRFTLLNDSTGNAVKISRFEYDVTVPAGETVTLQERSNNGIPPEDRPKVDRWRVTVTYRVATDGS